MAVKDDTPDDAERQRMKADFGLSWHVNGGWSRRFPPDRSRVYFGKNRAEAIARYHSEVRRRADGAAAAQVHADPDLNHAKAFYLIHLDGKSLSPGQRASYAAELYRFVEQVGKTVRLSALAANSAPDVIFRPARRVAMARGLAAAEKHLTQVRTWLRWCHEDRRYMPPAFYGGEFSPPSETEKRDRSKAQRRERGAASWTPAEVRQIVDAAKRTDVHRYAQVLLMLNGGMGSTDVSNLTDADVDWTRRCIDTDRSKTRVPRVVPLWDVTVEAMRTSRAARPAPSDPVDTGRFFLTPHGRPLVVVSLAKGTDGRERLKRTDALRNWFGKVLNPPARKGSGIGRKQTVPALPELKRHRAGGYTLRSCLVTFAAGQDRNLVAIILGQKLPSQIWEFYMRGDILAELRRVSEHVRLRVFPTA